LAMTGGPLFPYSSIPVTSAKVFPYVHIGGGSNSKHEEGMGVMASLDGDAIWRLRFQMPGGLPSGTCKLRLLALSVNGTGGDQVAKVNPKWASVAVGEDPSSATLNAEGTSTVTWGSGNANDDKYLEAKITLDADAPVASEIVVMDLTFETSSWSLTEISTWIASIIWE